jgi:hypothetical protein
MLKAARDLDESANKMGEQYARNNFGESIVKAVASKLRPRAAGFAATAVAPRAEDNAPDENSFGEEIKRAVERKTGGLPTQRQHQERVERERKRYRQAPVPPQPR